MEGKGAAWPVVLFQGFLPGCPEREDTSTHCPRILLDMHHCSETPLKCAGVLLARVPLFRFKRFYERLRARHTHM